MEQVIRTAVRVDGRTIVLIKPGTNVGRYNHQCQANKRQEVKKLRESMNNNHEVWMECERCGYEYDARLGDCGCK